MAEFMSTTTKGRKKGKKTISIVESPKVEILPDESLETTVEEKSETLELPVVAEEKCCDEEKCCTEEKCCVEEKESVEENVAEKESVEEHLNSSPGVYTITNFVTKEECDHMIELAKPTLIDSVVSDDKSGYKSPGRTSKTSWIDHHHDEITTNICKKISNKVGIPIENAEKFQVVYYGETNEYRAHCDSWDHDGSEKSMRCIKYGGQRLLTALVYLNHVEGGGETNFPKLKKSVSPELGKLLVFENVFKNTHNKHPLSEHAGMPVIKGEKYIFNLWYRECPRSMLYEDFNPAYYKPKEIPEAKLEHFEIKELESQSEVKKVFKTDDFVTQEFCESLIDKCTFSEAKYPNCWLKNVDFPSLMHQLKETLKIEPQYFENMSVVKYTSQQSHGPYFDAYDLLSENGKKHTAASGQRLQTIVICLKNELNYKFDFLNKKINLKQGTILYYDNISISEQRDSGMRHTLTNETTEDTYVLNVYVRKYDKNKNVNPLFTVLSPEEVETQNVKMVVQDPEDHLETYKEVLQMFEDKKITQTWQGHKSFKYFFKGDFKYFSESVLTFKNLSIAGKGLRTEHLEKEYAFDEYHPVVVENVVGEEMSNLLKTYYRSSIENDVFQFGDKQAQRFKANNEPFSRFLHYEILPLIRKITGKHVKPTYTYLSSYIKDADLPPHTDRPDCQYTVSFLVNKSHDWPIYAHKIKQPAPNKGRYWEDVPLEECYELHSGPNGLIIFCGTDHVHFRKVFTGDFYDILLLHYRDIE